MKIPLFSLFALFSILLAGCTNSSNTDAPSKPDKVYVGIDEVSEALIGTWTVDIDYVKKIARKALEAEGVSPRTIERQMIAMEYTYANYTMTIEQKGDSNVMTAVGKDGRPIVNTFGVIAAEDNSLIIRFYSTDPRIDQNKMTAQQLATYHRVNNGNLPLHIGFEFVGKNKIKTFYPQVINGYVSQRKLTAEEIWIKQN